MREIIEKILSQPELLARYKALRPDDAAGLARLARDAGFDVSERDLAAQIESAAEGELSEEALEKVAAGYVLPNPCGVERSGF